MDNYDNPAFRTRNAGDRIDRRVKRKAEEDPPEAIKLLKTVASRDPQASRAVRNAIQEALGRHPQDQQAMREAVQTALQQYPEAQHTVRQTKRLVAARYPRVRQAMQQTMQQYPQAQQAMREAVQTALQQYLQDEQEAARQSYTQELLQVEQRALQRHPQAEEAVHRAAQQALQQHPQVEQEVVLLEQQRALKQQHPQALRAMKQAEQEALQLHPQAAKDALQNTLKAINGYPAVKMAAMRSIKCTLPEEKAYTLGAVQALMTGKVGRHRRHHDEGSTIADFLTRGDAGRLVTSRAIRKDARSAHSASARQI